MMVIPFRINSTEYSVFVVFGQENLDRILQYDPAEVTLNKLGAPWDRMRLKDVLIGFATAAEEAEVMRLSGAGEGRKALQMLSRGFRYKPDTGDHDGPYLSMRTGNEGPKQ